MFDLSWKELLVTGIVALVVIGPKELPTVMRSAGRFVRRVRLVAGEFQQQFEAMADVAELEEIKKKAVIDANAISPVLSEDAASRLSGKHRDNGEPASHEPLISKEETYTTPDGALTLIVVREDDDVTVSFKGYGWHSHGDVLIEEYALIGENPASEVMAARRLVDDLTHDRAYIVMQYDGEDLADVWIRLGALEHGDALPDGQKIRLWSGALPDRGNRGGDT